MQYLITCSLHTMWWHSPLLHEKTSIIPKVTIVKDKYCYAEYTQRMTQCTVFHTIHFVTLKRTESKTFLNKSNLTSKINVGHPRQGRVTVIGLGRTLSFFLLLFLFKPLMKCHWKLPLVPPTVWKVIYASLNHVKIFRMQCYFLKRQRGYSILKTVLEEGFKMKERVQLFPLKNMIFFRLPTLCKIVQQHQSIHFCT